LATATAARRPHPLRLTAALIVRDEAAFLPECLASIRSLADEIVVVDTGSVDASREVAAAAGARLVDFPWKDDFSAARNEALAYARGAWILYIDADERVGGGDRAALDALLDDPGLVACTVRFRPRSGYTRYREYRLFRNDPRIRFAGIIHESMLPGIRRVAAEDGGRIGQSDLAIDHLGYDGDLAAKHRRNLPLLRARLAAAPGHTYCWQQLGHALLALGDEAGAVEAWARGLEVVRRRPAPAAADRGLYLDALLHAARAAQWRPPLLDEALRYFPDDPLLAWIHGRTLIREGRHAEAIAIFEDLCAVDAETRCDDRVAYDARLFGTYSHDALGLCCFRLGRFRDSAHYYALAEAGDPGNPAYRARRLLAEARSSEGP
jgi:glycosyltransferase involved in cell wall biosynthesis